MGGLIQARNLQRAADGPPDARRNAVREFVQLWNSEIREHFDDEERLLLPLTASAEPRDRLVSEHRVLRDLAAQCERDAAAIAQEPGLMRRIGTLLHDHIRWEERIYFEAVQRDHPEALAALINEADRVEAHRPRSRPRHTLEWPHTQGDTAMSHDRMDRTREAPADRFAPGNLVLDLHAEAASLRAEQASSGRAHVQKTLYKHAGRTLALFVLSAGGGLPEHAANGTVSVQPIEGELEMTVAGEPRRLRPGSLLVMAPRTRHDVRAPAPAVFLLQVSLEPTNAAT